MDHNTEDHWISRQELAERYGLPVKTPAQWGSKGTEASLRRGPAGTSGTA